MYFLTCFFTLFILGCSATKPLGSSSGSSNPSSGNAQDPNQVSNYDSPLVDHFLKLLASIGNRAPQLEREKDRRGKLMLELAAKVGTGCMYDVNIQTVEFILDGDKEADFDVSTSDQFAENLNTSIDTAAFNITLSDSTGTQTLNFANDEKQSQMFALGTHHVFKVTDKTVTIGSIDQIQINKLKANYIVTDFCDGAKFTGCTAKKKIMETDRYLLSNLTIKINGQIFYEKSNIHQLFAFEVDPAASTKGNTTSMQWVDQTVQSNSSFTTLMRTNDCSSM